MKTNGLIKVIRGDCFEVAQHWADESVDLVVTDPPYGGILKEDWDATASYEELGMLIERLLVPAAVPLEVREFLSREFDECQAELERLEEKAGFL